MYNQIFDWRNTKSVILCEFQRWIPICLRLIHYFRCTSFTQVFQWYCIWCILPIICAIFEDFPSICLYVFFMPIFRVESINEIRSKGWGVFIFPISMLVTLLLYDDHLIYLAICEKCGTSSGDDVRQVAYEGALPVYMTNMVQRNVNIINDDVEDIPDDDSEELDDDSEESDGDGEEFDGEELDDEELDDDSEELDGDGEELDGKELDDDSEELDGEELDDDSEELDDDGEELDDEELDGEELNELDDEELDDYSEELDGEELDDESEELDDE